MKAFKGFNPDMTCRGFQYEEGKTYIEEFAILCNCGFHACEAPIDVLGYYAVTNNSCIPNKFHKVELEDVVPATTEDTKRCGKKITIKEEMDLFAFVRAQVEWTEKHHRTKIENESPYEVVETLEDSSAIINAHDYSILSNLGMCSVIENEGYGSTSVIQSDHSLLANYGNKSIVANTGDNNGLANKGDFSVVANIGQDSLVVNEGNNSIAVSLGEYTTVINKGKASLAIGWGRNNIVKAAKDSYMVLTEWDYDKDDNMELVNVKMVKVDGKRIKPNKFYKLMKGKVVEVDEQ